MGGKLTFPGGGLYHATKHAVEAISDALRFEVRGFGIRVVVIEPGLIRTGYGEAAANAVAEGTDAGGPYGEFNQRVADATVRAYEQGPLAKLGGPPEAVARKIEQALIAEKPRARYTVTPSARAMLAQRALLPDGAWDALMRSQFPQPGSS
jgi:NAD(P)-dependent dehydrogenase (short-subunit alcohol dehydrogenase family)